MKFIPTPFLLISILLIFSCEKSDIPVVSEWIGLKVKDNVPQEIVFKTDGKGKANISWWAGGYTWPGGYFIIELEDVKKQDIVLRRVYNYGDKATGNDELPKFKWWHSEEKQRVELAANRVYKMKLHGQGIAQPGAGWGLWLYKIGKEEPKRQGGWQGFK